MESAAEADARSAQTQRGEPTSRFLRACYGLPVDRVPVWYMRQAGRYQPSYREIRKTHNLLDIVRDPELCARVTLRPVQELGVDAAILFSDIMVPLGPMGIAYTLEEHVGPVLATPIRSEQEVRALRPLEPARDLPYVLAAIERIRDGLARMGSVPLIGFAGAPFTLLSYLVEGRPTRSFLATKALMHGAPEVFRSLMERLSDAVTVYLRAQAEAGADALMLFDSWAGALAPQDYARFVVPHLERILADTRDLSRPRILFGLDTGELLPLMGRLGAEVVGVDWRVPLDEARRRLPPHVAVQGNLDPALLLAPRDVLVTEAADVLRRGASRPGYIFNLGHGVFPETDPAALQALTEAVHAWPLHVSSDTALAGTRQAVSPAHLAKGEPTMSLESTIGLVVMAYGTPRSREEILPYYTHIRHGHPPTPEQLAELATRYEAIGGRSPLMEITEAQAAGLSAALECRHPGTRFPVYLGMKHASPFIADAVTRMAADGVERAVGVVLAPLYSHGSTDEYVAEVEHARKEAGGVPGRLDILGAWHDLPAFRSFVAEQVQRALATFPPAIRDAVEVVFTAHSLPVRLVEMGDPYAVELRDVAEDIAARLGLSHYRIGWQSAGRTSERWLGPDILEIVRADAEHGAKGFLVVPVGFVSDHLEVLYDLDVEAAALAKDLGVAFARTPSPNAQAAFIEALADAVDRGLRGEGLIHLRPNAIAPRSHPSAAHASSAGRPAEEAR